MNINSFDNLKNDILRLGGHEFRLDKGDGFCFTYVDKAVTKFKMGARLGSGWFREIVRGLENSANNNRLTGLQEGSKYHIFTLAKYIGNYRCVSYYTDGFVEKIRCIKPIDVIVENGFIHVISDMYEDILNAIPIWLFMFELNLVNIANCSGYSGLNSEQLDQFIQVSGNDTTIRLTKKDINFPWSPMDYSVETRYISKCGGTSKVEGQWLVVTADSALIDLIKIRFNLYE